MRSLIHTFKYVLGLEAPFSQVTEGELNCLLNHTSGAEVIVEIGCYEGRTTAALAGCRDATVYSIDPFFKGRLGLCYGELIAKSYCRKKGLTNIRFLKAFSYDAALEFNSDIDFLFLDADHTFEATKRDWEDWFPKVREGGIIALHDSRQAPNSPEYLGSMKFYEEYLPQVPEVTEIDGIDSLAVLKVRK
jgi:predicted O-methyltransferase YrrM